MHGLIHISSFCVIRRVLGAGGVVDHHANQHGDSGGSPATNYMYVGGGGCGNTFRVTLRALVGSILGFVGFNMCTTRPMFVCSCSTYAP